MDSKQGLSEPIHFWALGRIGARAPLYGPLDRVVPVEHASRWLAQLLAVDWPEPDRAAFPMAQLGRRTGDRARDIDPELRVALAERVAAVEGGERLARLVQEVVALEAREELVAFGDTLPPGLRLTVEADVTSS